ncbi:MAG: D-alanyl-D-alanine carboxypeptidase [Lachnospiraceae bacterium]|nr:D-alanyl-D-alanine carboxypeptidase [Lachnospiraceae bacterium]
MKIVIGNLLLFLFLLPFMVTSEIQAETTATGSAVNITARAAVLIEGDTGEILVEKDKDTELVPASITKIMTLTLIFEAIDQGKISLEDNVTVSEYAASMGGSQVFLEPQETQTVNTMIKCISIASANDAAVAMAEKIAGSEQNFVKMMNQKAKELGMKHTQFKNCTGLDDDIQSGHYSSAYDVALMSRELIMKHPQISNYSTVWMDSIVHKTKKGESTFGLTNTNKLVRFYDGITGLKTGSTSKAKYCLSATAKRNGMNLIAVVMAAPDHKVRFTEAQALLDYGFANCSIYEDDFADMTFEDMAVRGGIPAKISVYPKGKFSHTFTSEFDESKIQKNMTLREIAAPVAEGDEVGSIVYTYDGKEIGSVPIVAKQSAEKAGYTDLLFVSLKKLFLIGSGS